MQRTTIEQSDIHFRENRKVSLSLSLFSFFFFLRKELLLSTGIIWAFGSTTHIYFLVDETG